MASAVHQANTFEAVARLWWEHWKDGKSERHAAYAIKRLEADAFPVLGARPIASHLSVSMWEAGSHLNALIAAESLIVSTHHTPCRKARIIEIAPCPPKPVEQVSRRPNASQLSVDVANA